MNNYPFLANNTNILDETFYSTTPTYINGQNVFLSQEKQRKMHDTLNTSIVGLAPPANSPHSLNIFTPANFIQAERYVGPSGVIFTFPAQVVRPSIGAPGLPQPCYPCMARPCPNPIMPTVNYPAPTTPQAPIDSVPPAMYPQMPQMNQEQLSQNPFFLQNQPLPFHYDKATTSFDLLPGNTQVPGCRGAPDLRNISGVVYQQAQLADYHTRTAGTLQNTNYGLFSDMSPDPCRYSQRRLRLKATAIHPQQHVADILDKPASFSDDQAKKTVTFASCTQVDTAEKSEQVWFPCFCPKDKPDTKSNEVSSNTDETCASKVKKFFRKSQKKDSNDKITTGKSEKSSSKGRNKKKVKKTQHKQQYEDSDSYTSDSDAFCKC
ncbi:uncharacterized protein [Diabrotica undecimpunctata]|uniref:uncharacterized protein isoform X2 n=1 Tax=Diabrotica undecimpunctata TaxID=50387 RepID=UPI003B635D37